MREPVGAGEQVLHFVRPDTTRPVCNVEGCENLSLPPFIVCSEHLSQEL